MKGTLFSADFVKDSDGNLRLLELNTDTAFTSGALSHVDFTEFINLISDNNIREVHIIYKEFHKNFVQSISQSLRESGVIDSFLEIKEDEDTIYPTQVEDSDSKFILRLAYDESALFDSDYCKQKEEVFKLFYDNNNTNSIPELFISSLGLNIDTLQRVINSPTMPDVVVKNLLDVHSSIKFYKIGGSGTVEDNFNQFIESNYQDSLILNYYENISETTHKGIRSFNIIYGNNLDILNLANVEVNAVFDKPVSIDYDLDIVSNLIHEKHYYEYASNYPQDSVTGEDGIFEGEYISGINNEPILISDVVIGNSYKSLFVYGAPDSDDPNVFLDWSYGGSELPDGSYVTTSALINSSKNPLEKGIISKITTEESASFRLGASQYLLVYESSSNELKYKSVYNIDEETDYLLKDDNGITKVISNDIEILEGTHYTYTLDLEDADTFMLYNSGLNIKVIGHNCFPAGTRIILADGSYKNIEELTTSDILLTYDTNKNEYGNGNAHSIRTSIQNKLIHISTNTGQEIKSTPLHKFYTKNNGWKSAEKLLVDDILINKEGIDSIISSINVLNGDVKVYHIINVRGNHTYFAENILVHNFKSPVFPLCFIAGTQVSMADGTEKNIEDVVIGDEVLSYNEVSGIIESKKVIKLNSPIHDDLVEYTLLNGNKITSTFDHPYYVNGLSLASYRPDWTNERYELPNEVTKIKVGDLFNLVSKETAKILLIVELDRVDTQTYIISVEGNRNFYANKILVHNK